MSDSWDPMDCNTPSASGHGISQARILEWVTFHSLGDLPNPGIKSHLLHRRGPLLSHQGSPQQLCCQVTSVVSNSVWSHRPQPTRLPRPWDSPGKNTGVGCHFPLQCMKVKSESKVAQSCPTRSDPMDCSPPGSSVHGIFQARVLEWGATAFTNYTSIKKKKKRNDLVWINRRELSAPDLMLCLLKQPCVEVEELGLRFMTG